MVVIKIRKKSSDEWMNVPATLENATAFNALDGENSGRDNSTGDMFREYITEKKTLSVTFPQLYNEDTATILNIIRGHSFQCYYPDSTTGQFETKTFYCSSVQVPIKKIINSTKWLNDTFTVEMVEM